MESIINLIALSLSLISLIIAMISLKIAKDVYKYTSRDYLPDIDWEINEANVLLIKNRSKKLFTILNVAFLQIRYFGYEDHECQATVQVPFVTISRMASDFQNNSSITISSQNAHACAYICPYSSDKVKYVEHKIQGFFPVTGPKIYLPSLQSVMFLVEITYANKFRENKTVHYSKKHFHGSGYYHSLISSETFLAALKNAEIPKFEKDDELWGYISRRYAKSWV